MSKRSKRRKRRIVLAVILATLAVFTAAFRTLDQRLLPTAMEIASDNIRFEINRCINEAIRSGSEVAPLQSSDFYMKTSDSEGTIQSLSVNTMLVNDVCISMTDSLSSSLSEIATKDVSVPVGALTGVASLANFGPMYPIKLMPVGAVDINYESSFTAEGINQINFQIWLNVRASIKIVNPYEQTPIVVTRRVLLVNALIPGEVPNALITSPNLSGPDLKGD